MEPGKFWSQDPSFILIIYISGIHFFKRAFYSDAVPGALDLKNSTFMMRVCILILEAAIKILGLDLLLLAIG